ncbi:Bromodomain [Macleaya cordata]|uniref:Bromodomain n=1 Tax=Macleaya cordata TaxID=56857 RepID=A0A200RA63_MACCD|nr:Bromodomain [Macleaya cordata]
MGKIVEKKKKKKGRPSLLDLQKRNLREQQKQQEKRNPNPTPKPNPNPYSNSYLKIPIVPSPNPNPNPNRRSTRRNPNPDGITSNLDGEEENDYDDGEDSNGKRREKQLNHVLRLPPNQLNQRSSVNSPSLQSDSYTYNSNGEDENGETPLKKQKINAVSDRSAQNNSEKGEKQNSTLKVKDTFSGTILESGPTTPLPDPTLLVFILDRLQKKDTYGVYAEPVDPEELPDYHEIIEHPMDFGTVRKKLSSGAYANLEQFEKDVFLICSNAMQYNEPHTIYFRQARSIQELAKKNFENLRQDSDDNEPEQKIVRRGRPPTKNLKKQLGRPPSDRAGTEFSDPTLVPGGDNSTWSNSYDLRKGHLSDKSGLGDASGRTFHGSRNSEAHTSLLPENRSEWNDEFPGFTLKGMSMKFGKKQLVLDENRRNTYQKSYPSAGGRELSVLTTFDGEKKQLMAVGLHTEHGFTRSLARFAANLGPVIWKIASKKIERALPAGIKFGPGWVGENDSSPQQAPILTPLPPRQLPPQAAVSQSKISSSSTHCAVDNSSGEKSSEKQEPSYNSCSDVLPNRTAPSSTTAPPSPISNRPPDPSSNSGGGFSYMNNSGAGLRPNPPFQIRQSSGFNHPINGFHGGSGFNLTSQMGKPVRPPRPMGGFSSEASMNSQMPNAVSRSSSNFVQSIPATSHSASGNSSTINSSNPPSSLQRLPSMHQKADSVPPDLNVRFQSPGSPSSRVRVDSPQPDLALQL